MQYEQEVFLSFFRWQWCQKWHWDVRDESNGTKTIIMVLKIAIIVVLLCFNISHGAQSLSLPHAKNPRIQKSGITSGFHALISHRQGQLTEPSPIKSASFGDANLRPKKPALGSFSDIFGLGKQSSEKIQPKHRQPRKFDHSHRIGAASTIQNTNVRRTHTPFTFSTLILLAEIFQLKLKWSYGRGKVGHDLRVLGSFQRSVDFPGPLIVIDKEAARKILTFWTDR